MYIDVCAYIYIYTYTYTYIYIHTHTTYMYMSSNVKTLSPTHWCAVPDEYVKAVMHAVGPQQIFLDVRWRFEVLPESPSMPSEGTKSLGSRTISPDQLFEK